MKARANERNGKLAFAFYSECSRASNTQSVFKAKDLLLYNSLVIASWYFLEIGMLSKLSCLSSATMVPVLSLCTIFMYAGFMKYDLWQRTSPRFVSVSSSAFIDERRMNFFVLPWSW